MPQKTLSQHNRPDMVKGAITENNSAIDHEYRKGKFEKMSASPYSFYRGTNHLYWKDFYNDWRVSLFGGRKETLTWINGDAHVYNFGVFGNHEGEALYGLDDFDDSFIGDYQYDLWRMVTSMMLDARDNGEFGKKTQKKAVKKFAKAYLKEVKLFEEEALTTNAVFTDQTTTGKLREFLLDVEEDESRAKMLEKWTEVDADGRRFDYSKKKLQEVTEAERKAIIGAMPAYRKTLSGDFSEADKDTHFKMKDIARRLWAGTGSLGLDRFYILLEGDQEDKGDDIILDVKYQTPPPVYDFMNEKEREEYSQAFEHEGERHALAFMALAEHPDNYLGWMELPQGVFSVRERSPFKEDFETSFLKKKKDFYALAKDWGKILATQHKRASQFVQPKEEPFLFSKTIKKLTKGKKKGFWKLLVEIAFNYSECVCTDCETFIGMVEVEEG